MRQLTFLLLLLCGLRMSAQQSKALSKAESDNLTRQLTTQWKAEISKRYADVVRRGVIRADSVDMRIWSHTYGQEPLDGRSLYISLHGGGGCPAEINDQQWSNQTLLYRPAEGVYVCPRAPYNTWNMWFMPALDILYQAIIDYYVATANVNPNRVYLMGYSAGGDGVWRMGPRMADRWAAASMMAGHPGSVSLLSLRNTPFMIWCGAEDSAYDRNRLCALTATKLDSLHQADPAGYINQSHIVEGKPHWMDQVDTLAVPWMAKHTRNPYPKQIVWSQGDVTHHAFYWVSVPKVHYDEYTELRADIKDNTINITHSDYPELTLWLNDRLVDLDKPVIVRYKNKQVYKGKLKRTASNLRESLWERHDPNYAFPAKVTVKCR